MKDCNDQAARYYEKKMREERAGKYWAMAYAVVGWVLLLLSSEGLI